MEEALKIMPKNDMILFQLGRLYGILGKIKEAKSILSKAVEANPMRSDGWFSYALAAIQSGEEDHKVLEYLHKALSLNPLKASTVPIYTLMSHIYVKQGNMAKVQETSALLDEARQEMLHSATDQLPMQWTPKMFKSMEQC